VQPSLCLGRPNFPCDPRVIHSPLSDEELSVLARAAANRDASATEKLLLELLPRVRNLVRYLVRGDRDVDDLTQEALLMILRGVSTYRGEGLFRAWADRVVARSVFSRKRRPALVLFEEDLPAQVLRGEELTFSLSPDTYTLRRQLVTALDKLPDPQRDALVLHHAVGLSVTEVAAELSAPEETIRSRIRLGKAKLREQLDDAERRKVG
jgi:RNA polymerase sigma-70 factor, ECF subfamily